MLTLDETLTGIRIHTLNRQNCDGCPFDGLKRGCCTDELFSAASYWLWKYKILMVRQEDDLR